MKKLLTGLFAVMASLTPSMVSAQEQANIAEMVVANPDLAQGQLSSDTYTVVTKNYSGTVTNTKVTVMAVGPDVMFVRDGSQKYLAVERPMSKPAFNTFYEPGNQIESLVVRYKANYVARGLEQVPVPYSVFEGDEYTKTTQKVNVSYSMCVIPNMVTARDYAVVGIGKGSSLNETVEATWNPATEEFDFDYASATTTYKMHVKAGAMGLDCSEFKPVTCSIYAAGVLQPTDEGFDIYPNIVRQDALVELDNIAQAMEEAKKIDSANGESYNPFHINSQLKINAVSSNKMFIQDESGAMMVKSSGAGVDFTSTGLKAGDLIDGLTLNLYYSTKYGAEMYGIYKSAEMPATVGFSEVEYPLETVESLRENSGALNCRPVMLENVRVKSDAKFEGLSVNPTEFFPGFAFDNRKYYTVKAIYQGDHSSLSVVWAEATGDVPAIIPVDVESVGELLEKGATLLHNGMSEEIYRITGKVMVVKNSNYMFIQDAGAAAPVQALANSSIQNAPYGLGSMVEGLCLRVQNINGLIQGYYDVDESQWPEPIEGEKGLPQIISASEVESDVEFRWLNVRGVEAAARTTFKLDGLHIASAPAAAATITCNANLGSASIAFTKGDIYNITGCFVGRRGTNGVTQWQFYASAWEKAASTNPVAVEDIAELKESLKNLADGEISEDAYELGPIYVTLRTADKIFVQQGDDGMQLCSANADYNLAGFDYKYGDVVNGFQGKVKRNGETFTMLLDPMAFPPSTMNLSYLIDVQPIAVDELADNTFVMVSLENILLQQPLTRAAGLMFNGLNVVDTVVDTDEENDTLEDNLYYNLTGLSDGENFYVYTAQSTGQVGVNDIDSEKAGIEAVYTVDGLKKATLDAGINIVRMTDGSTKKVIIRK